MRTRRGTTVLALMAVAALTPLAAAAREAAPVTGVDGLQQAADAFDGARVLSGAARDSALRAVVEQLGDAARWTRGSTDRVGAAALEGAVRAQLSDWGGAAEAWRRAAREDDKGPFVDDAEFARIAASEGAGEDADAAREWTRWEKEHPQSPLMPEARLREGWNAVRRGNPEQAHTVLETLVHDAPWMAADPRVRTARAMVAYLQGHAADALATLGDRPDGAAAVYLRGLILAAQGARLPSAAAFQQVAERWPDSPLRDHALLAKADAFLAAGDWRSATAEFGRVAARVQDPAVRAEAELRAAGARFLAGDVDSSQSALRDIAARYGGTDVAARAQFLVGEALVKQGRPADAIVEYNRVLTQYFQHSVAASAQYRVARCLDALGRRADATGSYQAVVAGYPLEPEAPAAAYLAGVGLMDQGRPRAAIPYFQLVLDRYAGKRDGQGMVVFAAPEHAEIVQASLCLLELAYHRVGDLGQLSGAPHLLLQKMPPSRSPWRAYALLIDADAASAQGRYPEAQNTLEGLARDFPDHPVAASATKLLAWTYARQGRDSLAIATEERLVSRYAGASPDLLGAAFLDIAHERFNQKRYRDAAGAYEDFLRRFPGHPRRLEALYQAGLCYARLERAGDAIDRWETLVRDSADAPLAERAWARAGDLYFQAERYADAERCYQGLLAHFANSDAAALATLRLGQCAYNAGRDDEALTRFSDTETHYPGTPAAREAHRGTESALYRLSQRPDGARVLARLVEQYPGSAFAADAQFQIARRAYAEKRWPDAAEGFRRVVSGFPGYSAADQAQYLMAEAFEQAHDDASARGALEQFLSFFPTSPLRPAVRFRIGLADFGAKDYGGAVLAFTEVLADSSGPEVRGPARFDLALCLRMLGEPDSARVQLDRYRAEHGDDARAAEVAYQLGDLAETGGRTAEALAEFDRALAAHPAAALAVELHFRAGRCHEQLGETTPALREYELASAAPGRYDDPFRLSSLARGAALYESRREVTRALIAYRDIIRNAKDRELVAAATSRVSQLEASARKR